MPSKYVSTTIYHILCSISGHTDHNLSPFSSHKSYSDLDDQVNIHIYYITVY